MSFHTEDYLPYHMRNSLKLGQEEPTLRKVCARCGKRDCMLYPIEEVDAVGRSIYYVCASCEKDWGFCSNRQIYQFIEEIRRSERDMRKKGRWDRK